jgi:hypothetical protein
MKQWNPEAYKQENIPPEDFAEVDALIAAKRKAKPAQKPKANGEDKFLDGVQNDQVIVELECAANIKPEPILWLWENWLALGKLHIPRRGWRTPPNAVRFQIFAKISPRSSILMRRAQRRWEDEGRNLNEWDYFY